MHVRPSKQVLRWYYQAFCLVLALCVVAILLSIHEKAWPPAHLSSLVWSPSHLTSCLSTPCLLSLPFRPILRASEASTALPLLRNYLRKHVVPPPPLPLQSSSPHPMCSVIGGAPISPNSSHSLIIDSTIVFRLNLRLPEFLTAESHATTLGTRTDILLIQRAAVRSFERFIHGWGDGNLTLAASRRHAAKTVQKRLPAIIYRTECPGRFKACPKAWLALQFSSLPKWGPLQFLSPHFEIETIKVLTRFGLYSKEVPTTGAVAIVAALSICKQVMLFAFNGSIFGDADYAKAAVWRGHHLKVERRFVRWLSICPGGESWLCGRLRIYS